MEEWKAGILGLFSQHNFLSLRRHSNIPLEFDLDDGSLRRFYLQVIDHPKSDQA